ncbi:bZIP transcription factor 60 [Platanthera zijinensis]|uniref:BZIP transcription factor 60 n=1 Tax=Platanthera zijinensis TaxID=2320716 RepID=A0AAP0AXL6_9ASPA
MRNRESAIKSRERKKMYTKDLEMKSKYLESECRRLDNLLRCYMVENSVLRQSLQFQKERICGASMAKQESAVLFVGFVLALESPEMRVGPGSWKCQRTVPRHQRRDPGRRRRRVRRL